MSWVYPLLLLVLNLVACQLNDFSSQVLKDRGEVNWSTCTNSLCIAALLAELGDSRDRELESCLLATGHSLALASTLLDAC